MDKSDRIRQHQVILEGAIFRWLNKHPVFFCDQVNAALRASADKWLAEHSTELLDYLRERFIEEIRLADYEAEKNIDS
jgi:hypothetical protein